MQNRFSILFALLFAVSLAGGCAVWDETVRIITEAPGGGGGGSDEPTGPIETAPGQTSRVHVTPTGTEIHFLEGGEARAQIVNDRLEPYFAESQSLELQVKMRRAAGEGETVADLRNAFKELKKDSVMAWTDAEVAMLSDAFDELAPMVEETLPGLFPPILEIIKTDGRDESGAFYTSDRAIVIPEMRLSRSAERGEADEMLKSVIIHEAYHVWSRLNMRTRDALWATLGYRPVGRIDEGEYLRSRRLTNPDASTLRHALELTAPDGEEELMTQVLFLPVDEYSEDLPLFGAIMTVELAEIERNGPIYRVRHDADGMPVTHRIEDVPDFFDTVSRNTGYILHPEELASETARKIVMGSPPDGERGAEVLRDFQAAWPTPEE